jgi:hypothetical protein
MSHPFQGTNALGRDDNRAMSGTTTGKLQDTLTIGLEDAATRSVWVSMLGLLTSQTQQWHFVGLDDGRVRYESPTFAAPYSWGTLPLGRTMLPRTEWAPDMNGALEELRAEILAGGWVEDGCGAQPWEFRYHRLAEADPR